MSMLLAALLLMAEPAADVRGADLVWVTRPTGEDMARAFPKRAAKNGLIGQGILNCTVSRQGTLGNCSTEAVIPAGEGFEEAIISLVPRFRMEPKNNIGEPVEGRPIRMPIRLILPGPVAPIAKIVGCYGTLSALPTRNESEAKLHDAVKAALTKYFTDRQVSAANIETTFAEARERAVARPVSVSAACD